MIFLKGLLMGACDVVPGVSGGTIAFITGVYQRLIDAVKSFSPKTILHLARFDRKEIQKLDLPFLGLLVAGIGVAVFLLSGVIDHLLETYYAFTVSFFIGLILASSIVIYKDIKDHSMKNVSFGLIGLLIGVSLAFVVQLNVSPSLLYVFFAGFVAISAMFLPGISGAFILLILGVYQFMLRSLHNISENLVYVVTFLLGAVVGAGVISRLISYLFHKDKNKTLYVLLGLVVGSLSVPVKGIMQATVIAPGKLVVMLLLLTLGFLIVFGVNRYVDEKKSD
ncbi:MAG: DUF368 domain-containing protein [Candidatus Woesearchaeota archaeon]